MKNGYDAEEEDNMAKVGELLKFKPNKLRHKLKNAPKSQRKSKKRTVSRQFTFVPNNEDGAENDHFMNGVVEEKMSLIKKSAELSDQSSTDVKLEQGIGGELSFKDESIAITPRNNR